ncbi:hypothetical protein, partial [Akkermansia sp.]|uniref:hypothetical protein n=1 Tax=Akkermansia sp. TaxID=1872421 RepID=UPI003AAD5760
GRSPTASFLFFIWKEALFFCRIHCRNDLSSRGISPWQNPEKDDLAKKHSPSRDTNLLLHGTGKKIRTA